MYVKIDQATASFHFPTDFQGQNQSIESRIGSPLPRLETHRSRSPFTSRSSSGDRFSRQLASRASYHRSVCQLREHRANTDDYRVEIAQTPSP